MNEFKLIVAGGRDFNDYDLLTRVLYALAEVELADVQISLVVFTPYGDRSVARRFALEHGLSLYYAESIAEACTHASGLLVFWNEQRPDLKRLVDAMQRLGKPTTVITY